MDFSFKGLAFPVIWRKWDIMPVPHDIMISVVGRQVIIDGERGYVNDYTVGENNGSGTIRMTLEDGTIKRFNREYIQIIQPVTPTTNEQH